MSLPKPDQLPQKTKNKPNSDLVHYSGISFQMIGVLLAATFGGRALDQYFQTQYPYYLLILLLLGVFMSMFVLIKGVIKR